PARRGETYFLEAAHHEEGAAVLEGVAAGTRDIVLRLGSAPRAQVRGTVTGADGRPAPRVRVRALRMPGGVHRLTHEDMGSTSFPDPTEDVETRTGPDGTFELPDLLPGEWLLVAGERGEPPVTANGVVRDAVDATPARLRVAAGWTLRARLLDEDGRPLARVEVTVSGPEILPRPARARFVRARTDEDGMLSVPALPPGTATVFYTDDRLAAHRFKVGEQGPEEEPLVLHTGR
ncbi:MAG: carboxypeptidase-like regulatory domain-containing protein, partial [Planctomycetota bacterium]